MAEGPRFAKAIAMMERHTRELDSDEAKARALRSALLMRVLDDSLTHDALRAWMGHSASEIRAVAFAFVSLAKSR